MADDSIQELTLKFISQFSADKASATKTGEDAGKAIKSGMDEVIRKSTSVADLTRNLEDNIRKATNKVFLEQYKENNKKNWEEVQKQNQAYKDMIGSLKYKSVFGEIKEAKPPEPTTWEVFKNTLGEIDTFAKGIGDSLGNALYSSGANGLKAMGSAIKSIASFGAKPFKQIGSAVSETTRHLMGFFSAIKRIAIYRAIRSALKAITQGFQEGIKNAYQWSVVTGNQFAKSMDMMATSALYLKNSLGAMTMPLMNYLAPILDNIIDKFVDLINVINQVIALVTGANSWVKALKYPAEYMEQASGSAKELKNQLLGFDDLNILKAPSGGGGASALDYSNMFENMKLTNKFPFFEALREAIKKGDWKGIGSLIATKFNEMIGKIEAIDLARSLGLKINNAISLIYTLLDEANFFEVGVKVGEFMSNLKLDWGKIASSWIRWNTNVLDAILGLFNGVNWGNVGRALGEYIKGLFNQLTTWLNGIDWYTKGQEFTQALIDFLGRVDWKGVADALWQFLKACLNSALDALIGALGKIEFDRYGQIIMPNLTNTLVNRTVATTAGKQGNAVTGSSNSHQHGATFYGGFASGGFPQTGTYFYAGEQGAEFVGQVGGRTAVYNADQMTNALATANEGVVETLVSVGNAIVGAINRKETSISANDIRRAVNRLDMRYGV